MPTPPPVTQNFTQILTKRRWSRSEAATAVQAWRDSAISLHAFCERHGIDEQRLAQWAKNFPVAPKFAEVVVVRHLQTFPISRARAACRRASFFGNYSYLAIKNILRKGLDLEPLPSLVMPTTDELEPPRFARNVQELLDFTVDPNDAPN